MTPGFQGRGGLLHTSSSRRSAWGSLLVALPSPSSPQMFLYNHIGQSGILNSVGEEMLQVWPGLTRLPWGHRREAQGSRGSALMPWGLPCFGAEADGSHPWLTRHLCYCPSDAHRLWCPGQRPVLTDHHCCLS